MRDHIIYRVYSLICVFVICGTVFACVTVVTEANKQIVFAGKGYVQKVAETPGPTIWVKGSEPPEPPIITGHPSVRMANKETNP